MIKHFLLTFVFSFFISSCAKPSEHQEKTNSIDHKSINKSHNSLNDNHMPKVTIAGPDLLLKTVQSNKTMLFL